MKILIGGSVPAYSYNDEEMLCETLKKYYSSALGKKDSDGNENLCDMFILPFKNDMLTAAEQVLAYNTLNTYGDVFIAVGYPMCTVPHYNKRIFLFETYPELYEHYSYEGSVFGSEQRGAIKRNLEYAEKNAYCVPGTKIFVGSEILRNDLRERFGVDAELLCVPMLQPKKLLLQDEDKSKIDKIPQNQFFVTESILSPETNVFRLLKEFDKLKNPLVIFVPNANTTYCEAFQRDIENKAKGKVLLVKGHISDEIYERAAGYLHFDDCTRKIKGAVVRAVKSGVPVIYTDDCGGAADFLSGYKNALKTAEGNLVNSANNLKIKNKYKKYDNTAEIREFAERILKG